MVFYRSLSLGAAISHSVLKCLPAVQSLQRSDLVGVPHPQPHHTAIMSMREAFEFLFCPL